MKRLSIFILCISLLISLAACAGSQPAVMNNEHSTTSTEPALTIPNFLSTKQESPQFNKTAVISETILYSENSLLIKATSLTYDYDAVILNLSIRNNGNEDFMIYSGSAGHNRNSINHYMMDIGSLMAVAKAGTESTEVLEYPYDYLQMVGISEIADICLAFTISGGDIGLLESEVIEIQTNLYQSHDDSNEGISRSFADSLCLEQLGGKLTYMTTDTGYNENGVMATAYAIVKKDGADYLFLEAENTTDDLIFVGIYNLAANGLTIESPLSAVEPVTPGSKLLITKNIDKYLSPLYRDALGISNISSVAFDLEHCDLYMAPLGNRQRITLDFDDKVDPFDSTGTTVYSKNNMEIRFKTISSDSFALSDDLHVLLLAENQSETELYIKGQDASLKVNGNPVKYRYMPISVGKGQIALMDIELNSDSLESLNISDPSQITDISFGVILSHDLIKIDTPTITMKP